VNELRNAGAEALAIDETRLTARSVISQGASALEVDGVAFDRRFTLAAIGDPDGLVAALQRPGGIVAQLEQFVSATITVTQTDTLRLPATTISLEPEAAAPAD
jgi:uncharacterized protein YlxW (UPF0749 family)